MTQQVLTVPCTDELDNNEYHAVRNNILHPTLTKLVLLAVAGLKDITGSASRFIQVPSIAAFSEAAAKLLLVEVCKEAIVPTRPGNST